ncbi:MAG: GTP-binding protein [Candidatus Helarchaeales archaeon]
MDLSPRVSRALRSIDGVIVVVDAVEGCQIQTEIVLKQALSEKVRPTLYINKIDRLIRELKLKPNQIQVRLQKIIDDFNDLLEIHAPEFHDEWKILPEKNNVVFGSAIYPNWGFSYEKKLQTGMTFNDIHEFYMKPDLSSSLMKLHELIPLSDSIFQMIIKTLPDPVRAQEIRIPTLWKDPSNKLFFDSLKSCADEGPTVICVNKVWKEEQGGFICTGRIFSGEIRRGMRLRAVNARKFVKVRDVYLFMGDQKARIEGLKSGNIAAFKILVGIKAGETLIPEDFEEDVGSFETFKYLTEPVLTVALEPRRPSLLDKMLEILNDISLNDPNIMVSVNRDTGEYLISGLGELHLEMTLKELEAAGVEVIPSKPTVVYRESIKQSTPRLEIKSRDGTKHLAISVHPLAQEEIDAINREEIFRFEKLFHVESHGNVIVNGMEEEIRNPNIKRILKEGFDLALKSGPLCDQPVRGIKIVIRSLSLDKRRLLDNPLEFKLMIRNLVFASILSGSPILLEPISRLMIQIPLNLLKIVDTLMAQKKGRILSIENVGNSALITCIIPIRNSIELVEELRSKSSGQAFWQTFFSHWQEMDEKEALQIIKSLRISHGRNPEIPSPEFFLNK